MRSSARDIQSASKRIIACGCADAIPNALSQVAKRYASVVDPNVLNVCHPKPRVFRCILLQRTVRADRMTSSSKSSRHWRHVGSKTTPISSTITWMSMRSNSWFPHPDGDITVQFTVEGIPLEVSLDGVDVIVEDESECVDERRSFVAETGNVLESPRPLDVPRPRETASRWPSFASLTRTPLRAPRALRCLRGRGRPRRPRPSESTRTVDSPSSDVVGWTGVYVPARPARRCRPLRVARSYTFSVRGVENAIF